MPEDRSQQSDPFPWVIEGPVAGLLKVGLCPFVVATHYETQAVLRSREALVLSTKEYEGVRSHQDKQSKLHLVPTWQGRRDSGSVFPANPIPQEDNWRQRRRAVCCCDCRPRLPNL